MAVRKAYLNMKSAEQTIDSTRVAVEQGQENFRIASLRYRAGVVPTLMYLMRKQNWKQLVTIM